MTDAIASLLAVALLGLVTLMVFAFGYSSGYGAGHRLGYCRGKRDGRQEMWDAFYSQRPQVTEVSAEIGEAIPMCQWCVDCDATLCYCKTCHPRD